MEDKIDIILLCNESTVQGLTAYLHGFNPAALVRWANSPEALRRTFDTVERPVRLLSFLTDVIVPVDIIETAGLTGYNIHPGTPEYPGSAPTSFAIWDEADSYGATAHEITARVDEGPIVATRRLPMPPKPVERDLGDLALAASAELFAVVGRHCALHLDDLPPSGEVWAGHKRTRAERSALMASFGTLKASDRARLLRACSDLRPVSRKARTRKAA